MRNCLSCFEETTSGDLERRRQIPGGSLGIFWNTDPGARSRWPGSGPSPVPVAPSSCFASVLGRWSILFSRGTDHTGGVLLAGVGLCVVACLLSFRVLYRFSEKMSSPFSSDSFHSAFRGVFIPLMHFSPLHWDSAFSTPPRSLLPPVAPTGTSTRIDGAFLDALFPSTGLLVPAAPHWSNGCTSGITCLSHQ